MKSILHILFIFFLSLLISLGEDLRAEEFSENDLEEAPPPKAETPKPEVAKEEKKEEAKKEEPKTETAKEDKKEEKKDDKPQIKGSKVSATVSKDTDAELNGGEKVERKAGVAKLLRKFTRPNGTPAPIAVLTPLDYTTLNFTSLAQETILASINRYGKFDTRVIDYSPAALTLEEFRKVVTRFDVDIVVLSVLKPTNFDVFLYDRRTPYNIYAHSETLPETVQYQLTKEVVEEYTKVIVRRALFAYMQDQFYELPREEARPFLNAEIPRFIASAQSFQTVNRELTSSSYASASVGAALSGGAGGLWPSNLVGLQFGTRIFGTYFAEFDIDLSAYNAFGPAIRYMFMNRDNPFRFSIGFGLASLMNAHTLNWDQLNTQGSGGTYIVPSVAFTFPIVDLHFKVESKLYVSIDGSKFILTLMPGLYFQF